MRKLILAATVVAGTLAAPSIAYAGYWGPYGWVVTCGYVVNGWGHLVYVCG
jgi:hypothetical protein